LAIGAQDHLVRFSRKLELLQQLELLEGCSSLEFSC
jgi:hypothetical protein